MYRSPALRLVILSRYHAGINPLFFEPIRFEITTDQYFQHQYYIIAMDAFSEIFFYAIFFRDEARQILQYFSALTCVDRLFKTFNPFKELS